ncbi:MAG TPA: hypothetical protein VMD76_11070 [Candidatus Sulfotelmatobacter sp.]|nr:hypothetical protein [Candidatus Sulfotelmatobacter sp.]
MPGKKVISFPSPARRERAKSSKSSSAALTREAVFSFLKDTRGMVSWTTRDLAQTLGIPVAQANEALPILEMQGYVKREGEDEWLTTIAGESVSGSVAPRYKKQAVEQALAELQGRIRSFNADRNGDFLVTSAVAFGDFLSSRARVQAGDVGIAVAARGQKGARPAAPGKQLLASLRARSPLLHLYPLAEWMTQRTHRKLV